MSEYRLDVKVRNNLIMKQIESLGYANVNQFCRAKGLAVNRYKYEIQEERALAMFAEREQAKLEFDDELKNETIESKLNEALSVLTPREQKILKMRFGIDDKEHTYEECAKEFDVTRERARQIEHKALRKLKYHTRNEVIQDIL